VIVRCIFNTAFLGALLTFSPLIRAVEEPVHSTITFEEALKRTLSQSPTLKTSQAEIEEREGERIQSGIYPNPFFSYSVENVLGNKHWKGWEAAESRYEVAQLVEIGGQRGHRSKAALYRYYAAQAEYASVQLGLVNELKQSFLEVVAAQELLELATQQRKTSEEALKAVHAKVEAGKVSPIEKNKAMLAAANSELVLQKAHVDLDAARHRLSLLWGSPCPDFDRAEYPFFQVDCPNSFQQCLVENKDNPELIKSEFNQLAASEELALENSLRIPDVIVTVGYKTVQNTNEQGMILGASFPLPLFDRNQGNIHRGRAETCRLANQYIEKQLQLESKLLLLHKEATRAYDEAMQLKTTLLQLAHESFTFARDGYNEGKFEYLDLLDSQRTLFDAQARYIQALLNFFKKEADIEYLTL